MSFSQASERYECSSCGCTQMTIEDVSVQTFPGNQEEPAEYEERCPECNSEVEEIPVFWCKTCEDEQVQHDGENCPECHTCTVEGQLDAMREGL